MQMQHCQCIAGLPTPELTRRQSLRQAIAAFCQQICTSWICLSTKQVPGQYADLLSLTCMKALYCCSDVAKSLGTLNDLADARRSACSLPMNLT